MEVNELDLVVCDMAGTTVRDEHEVERCFAIAAKETGLDVSDETILAVQGWSKRYVFKTLWEEQLQDTNGAATEHVDRSYAVFKEVLEDHYRKNGAEPTEGCVETLSWLQENGVKVALTTGFYRKVVDIILEKLGWLEHLDEHYMGKEGSLISLSIASDEVEHGRPAPDMIQKAMDTLGVQDPSRVVNIGDTPSDLASGFNANCLASIALTNGTHSKERLSQEKHDALLPSLAALPEYINSLVIA